MTRSGAESPSKPAVPSPAGRTPLWLVLAVVVAGYGAGASLAFAGFGAPSVVVLFLPAGVTLSALVLNPRRRWPWILGAVAVTEIVVDLSHGMSARWVWGFALANTAEPLVGALLLRRYVPAEVDLLRRRDLLAFLGCCVGAGPIVGAVIGATMLAATVGLPWPQSFVSFWAGDATGVLTVAGGVLAWRYSFGSRPGPYRWLVSVGAAVAATVIGFWPQDMPLFYLPIPVLFALAFSQPLLVTLTAGMATTVAANLMTSTGHGPWAALNTSDQLITITLQLFLATTILGAWTLAVGVAERDRALRRAQTYEREHDAAQQLQRALLPALASGLSGIQVCADYRPADVAHQVGGDWYDVFAVPDGRIGFAVGDVVGHQLAAAAAMARLQSALRILAQKAPGPAQALADLDRASALIPDAGTATVGYADYDPATRILRYACAGHLPPLLVTASGAEHLWDGRSLPLGVGQTSRGEGHVVLPDEASLVWYTDGLVERPDEHIAVNMQRLADAASRLGPADAATLCRHLLDSMVGDETLGDDTAILCVQFVATEPGAMADITARADSSR